MTYDDVYSHGTDWNGINDNVNVTVMNYAPGMPTISGQMLVMGEKMNPNVLWKTIPYDSNGNILYDGSMNIRVNDDWDFVRITLNTDTTFYDKISNKIPTARMTFIHEVGHALKLSHPAQSHWYNPINGHTLDGYPFAIMNQGYPSSEYRWVAAMITQHDIDCLNNKWKTT